MFEADGAGLGELESLDFSSSVFFVVVDLRYDSIYEAVMLTIACHLGISMSSRSGGWWRRAATQGTQRRLTRATQLHSGAHATTPR